jgi:hypothetical protein
MWRSSAVEEGVEAGDSTPGATGIVLADKGSDADKVSVSAAELMEVTVEVLFKRPSRLSVTDESGL